MTSRIEELVSPTRVDGFINFKPWTTVAVNDEPWLRDPAWHAARAEQLAARDAYLASPSMRAGQTVAQRNAVVNDPAYTSSSQAALSKPEDPYYWETFIEERKKKEAVEVPTKLAEKRQKKGIIDRALSVARYIPGGTGELADKLSRKRADKSGGMSLPPELGGSLENFTVSGFGSGGMIPSTPYAPPRGGMYPQPGYGKMSKGVLAVMAANGQLPVTANPTSHACLKCPPGYVKIQLPVSRSPGGTQLAGTRLVCVLRSIAIQAGLARAPRKAGGISSKQIRDARKVQHVIQSLTVNRKPRLALKKGSRKT